MHYSNLEAKPQVYFNCISIGATYLCYGVHRSSIASLANLVYALNLDTCSNTTYTLIIYWSGVRS